MTRALRSLVAVAVLMAMPAVARADSEEDAAAAYDRGAAAYDRGEHAVAAREFARADELAANDVTLELALTAVAQTDDAVLGMTLVERAESRRPAKGLSAAADAARKRFAASVGKIDVVCAVDPPCEAALDGAAIAPNRATLVRVGEHQVTIARNGTRETHAVKIEAGKTVQLIATVAPPSTAAPVTPPPRLPEPAGVSPIWFWVATGVTVAVSGVTALSALDTASTYDRFSADRSDVDLATAGKSAERRTVVLGITSAVLAAGTIVLGVAFVDWRGASRTAKRLGPNGWTF